MNLGGNKAFVAITVVAMLAADAVVFGLVKLITGEVKFDSEIGVAALTGIPLFVLTIMQLIRNGQIQRASFIKDYVSKFFTDSNLYDAYFDLIYNYDNEIFDKIDKIYTEMNLNHEISRPCFEPFDHLQNGRTEGRRLYHPLLFQGSNEEKKLDSFLGYLDIIGYYYYNGLVSIDDIAGAMGSQLAMVAQRKVIRKYLGDVRDKWREVTKLQPELTHNSVEQFGYLIHLLDDLDFYNKKRTKSIQLRLDGKR